MLKKIPVRGIPRATPKFTVYAGDGRYLERASFWSAHVANEKNLSGYVAFAGLESACLLDRREAVAACHASRAAGVPAWLVQHPDPVAAALRGMRAVAVVEVAAA